jgi:hypothetical protein
MRPRIRLVLPLIQVAIAVALIISNRLREQWGLRPAFLAPDLQFCCALSAPATVIWSVFRILKGHWYWAPLIGEIVEKLVYLVLVGLLWYVFSVEWGGRGQSLLTPKTKIRSVADVLMMAFAGFVAVFGLSVRSHVFGFVTTYSTLVATPYFLWALLIATFYGHDLWVWSQIKRGTSSGRTSGNSLA